MTGQVLWCAPLPVASGAGVAGGAAVTTPGLEASPGTAEPAERADAPAGVLPVRPYPAPRLPRLIPAGAALVAVQGTALGARTADDGRFQIAGVPAGQYLTVAAGPVATLNGAVALRPNVLVNAGQTLDIGRLTLAQPCPYFGPVPYAVPAAGIEPNE